MGEGKAGEENGQGGDAKAIAAATSEETKAQGKRLTLCSLTLLPFQEFVFSFAALCFEVVTVNSDGIHDIKWKFGSYSLCDFLSLSPCLTQPIVHFLAPILPLSRSPALTHSPSLSLHYPEVTTAGGDTKATAQDTSKATVAKGKKGKGKVAGGKKKTAAAAKKKAQVVPPISCKGL